jgi:hypothetical protein
MTILFELKDPETHELIRQVRYGLKCERATKLIPQTATEAIFTVATGRILVTGLIGEVTDTIGNVANATKITGNPTTGTDVDWCATVDVDNLEIGGKVTLPAAVASAATKALAGAIAMPELGLVCPIGTIDLTTAANSVTGKMKWTLLYVPIDNGATVTAA